MAIADLRALVNQLANCSNKGAYQRHSHALEQAGGEGGEFQDFWKNTKILGVHLLPTMTTTMTMAP